VSEAVAARPSRVRLGVIWFLRLFVALIFFVEGVQKFPESRMWVRVFEEIGFGQWFRYATGVIEVACAGLLLFPKATWVAVPLLVCTIIGALLTHVFIMGTGPHTALVSILLAALITIGWSEWRATRRGF
jgi:putative oxidoreductase